MSMFDVVTAQPVRDLLIVALCLSTSFALLLVVAAIMIRKDRGRYVKVKQHLHAILSSKVFARIMVGAVGGMLLLLISPNPIDSLFPFMVGLLSLGAGVAAVSQFDL